MKKQKNKTFSYKNFKHGDACRKDCIFQYNKLFNRQDRRQAYDDLSAQ